MKGRMDRWKEGRKDRWKDYKKRTTKEIVHAGKTI
jgi:hypothetical protein